MSYAYDEKGKGGSSGNKGVKWFDFGLKKKLVEPFERELINGIDSILEMKHIEQ